MIVPKLVGQIDDNRKIINLSSAIRLFVFNYYRGPTGNESPGGPREESVLRDVRSTPRKRTLAGRGFAQFFSVRHPLVWGTPIVRFQRVTKKFNVFSQRRDPLQRRSQRDGWRRRVNYFE